MGKNYLSFIKPYYLDCLNFCFDKNKSDKDVWDFICITSSNAKQASTFRQAIKVRKDFFSYKTKVIIAQDYKNKRIGSGGATLNIIKELKEKHNCDFSKHKILLIHSGGDSKRIPQYSALGKLFSPIPHIRGERPSTLFDEILISTSYIPSKIKSGCLVMSGDVLLLFNNLNFYNPKECAAAISFKEDINTAQKHGVFQGTKNEIIRNFLHKQPKNILMNNAVDFNQKVNLDTGAIFLKGEILNSLYSLVDTQKRFDLLVNEKVRLSFYGDFLYPLAEESTLEKFYLEKPENIFCDELKAARTKIWNALRQYRITLESFDQAKFIHVGTSREVLNLNTKEINDYECLGWSKTIHSVVPKNGCSSYLSIIEDGVEVSNKSYVESSYIHKNSRIGANSIVSFLEVNGAIIPDNVVVHGLKQKNGKIVVRIYGIDDNPKETKLFGIDIKKRFGELGLKINDFSNGSDESLWNLTLYPECDNASEALKESLNLYHIFKSNGDVKRWLLQSRKSLKSGLDDFDPSAINQWTTKLIDIIWIERLYKAIKEGEPLKKITANFKKRQLSKNQLEWLDGKSHEIPFYDLSKLYLFLGEITENERFKFDAFNVIHHAYINGYKNLVEERVNPKITKNELLVKMPLRINFGGGWTDTPPYCNEHGGTVLNTAILLNGEFPVSVYIKKLNENKIILQSDDMNAYEEFNDITVLQDTGNPFDEFALQKAVLKATGIVPNKGGNLHKLLTSMGGGFLIKSEVTNVPKGSGLGTSSILSACCVKAVFDFFGISASYEQIYSTVLCVEQIMSTGGGWQDQVGGLYPGIKLIESEPSLIQELKISQLQLKKETIDKLNDRLVLISTGQRRLARNLLRSVLTNYLTNEPDTLYALSNIKVLALEMNGALEKGDITLFGKLLDKHWKLSKMIDEGCTNALIEQIFETIDDLICGRMVVGAGGGGFLQVILKDGVSINDVKKRIDENFESTGVSVYKQTILL